LLMEAAEAKLVKTRDMAIKPNPIISFFIYSSFLALLINRQMIIIVGSFKGSTNPF
jgi:hypothetical protein